MVSHGHSLIDWRQSAELSTILPKHARKTTSALLIGGLNNIVITFSICQVLSFRGIVHIQVLRRRPRLSLTWHITFSPTCRTEVRVTTCAVP